MTQSRAKELWWIGKTTVHIAIFKLPVSVNGYSLVRVASVVVSSEPIGTPPKHGQVAVQKMAMLDYCRSQLESW